MANTQADERFKTDITPEQIKENLKVLAEFRTQEEGSSNLTIREGLFKKTTGKFNLFKKIVRDERDSLSNQEVLDAIYTNLEKFESTFDDTDDNFDILCNAMYGFLNLGSKYRGRDTVANIANTMSDVCKMALGFFKDRLEKRYVPEKTAAYSQGIYNRDNKVHLTGTCWAMVMDWARRFVLKEKMGYAHGLKPLAFDQEKLLHRGKYIASVFDLPQNQDYASVGDKLSEFQKNRNRMVTNLDDVSDRERLLAAYDEDRKRKIWKNDMAGKHTNTLIDKFNDLKFSKNVGDLGLCGIHIGNLDKSGKKNTRIECIDKLTNKINSWIAEAYAAMPYRIAHGINFWFDEKIGYQNWSVNTQRQLDSNGEAVVNAIGLFSHLGTKKVDQESGHALGFAYDPDPKSQSCCFMDPNFGEWVSRDTRKIASIIYDVLKIYTVNMEKGFKTEESKLFCAKIFRTEISLFARKKTN